MQYAFTSIRPRALLQGLFHAILPAAVLFSNVASAQVYDGAQDVTTDQEEHRALDEEVLDENGEIPDATELAIQGGGMVAGGNSQATAMTGLIRFLIRRGHHEGTADAVVNYARSGVTDDAGVRQGMETTVENYQGRLRYDYFWTRRFSTYYALQTRRDRFQGLNLRLGTGPGVTYYFFRQKEMRLWGEVAYDFQYDILTQDTLDQAFLDGSPRDRHENDHNARFFFGYDQKLDERLALLAGLEMFKSLTQSPYVRVNFLAELRTQLWNRFSLAIGSNTMYNSDPLPGVDTLDVTTSLSFVYTLL